MLSTSLLHGRHKTWTLLAAFTLVITLLGGCQPAPTPQPRPTPRVMSVQVTPALAPLREPFRACAAELENAGLVLTELPAYGENQLPAALSMRWGAGSQGSAGFTAVIGQEELAVIVHPANPLDQISLDGLRGLYSGALRSWPGSEPSAAAQPWAYPPGDDVQDVFQSAVMDGDEASTRAIYTAPDPAAMLEAVAGSPGAVGFVPRRWLENAASAPNAVKPITITDLNEEALRQPVLAISSSEPAGIEETWLICLQEQLSE